MSASDLRRGEEETAEFHRIIFYFTVSLASTVPVVMEPGVDQLSIKPGRIEPGAVQRSRFDGTKHVRNHTKSV